jgi:hypothetical protein
MNKGELIYLACPYMHKDPSVVLERVKTVNRTAGKLIVDGFYIYSPISHSHPIAQEVDLPGDWQFWQGFDKVMLNACKGLYVLKIPGWEQSIGVQAEIKIAKELGLEVEYIDPK